MERLVVLHDDAEREADYVKGAEKALEVARTEGWTVVSVKNDRSMVFAEPGAGASPAASTDGRSHP